MVTSCQQGGGHQILKTNPCLLTYQKTKAWTAIRDHWKDTVVRPKQVIYWPNLVSWITIWPCSQDVDYVRHRKILKTAIAPTV